MTVNGSNGRVIGRVALPASFAGLVWSADGKRLFAGGGFDDRIYRFDHADGLLSKKTVFEYPDRKEFLAEPNPEDGEKAKKHQRVPAGLAHHQGRQDALCRRGVRPFRGPIRRRIRSVSRRARTRGRQLSLWPGARRVAQAALCQPLEQGQGGRRQHRHHSRSPATGPPRNTPTRCCWRRGARSCSVANANRNTVSVIDTEAGKPIETIGTAIDPKAPPGSTPNSLALSPDESMLFVANANTNNLAVVNVKDPGGSAPLGFIPVGWYPTSVAARSRRQDDLRDQRQGWQLASQPRRSAPGLRRRPQSDPGIHRRPLPGHALDHPDAGPPADGQLFADRLRVQPARGAVIPRPSPDQPRPGKPDPRQGRRRRRRSSTSSTSSRKTAPTTRSSAT